MKRQTFIKQLMAAGMPRNMAADVATLAQEARRPYFNVLGDLLNHARQLFSCSWLLSVMRVRSLIINGYGHPATHLFRDIDEWGKMDTGTRERALQALGRWRQ